MICVAGGRMTVNLQK